MKRESIRVVWAKLEMKQEVILYLRTYLLPQSDLIFRNEGSTKKAASKTPAKTYDGFYQELGSKARGQDLHDCKE